MSDHEGAGHDNWEAISLPGGPTHSVSSRRGHESLDRGIRPRGLDGLNGLEATQPQPRMPVAPRRPRIDPGYRPQIQAISGIAHRPGGVHHRKPRVAPEVWRSPINNEARRDCNEGKPSVAHHQLDLPWKGFLRNFSVPTRQVASQKARDDLDDICRNTNTWINTPADNDVRIEVWGSEEDAQRAVAELQIFHHHIRQTGPRPNRDMWLKQPAHDGRVEDRNARNLRDIELSSARYELNKQTRFEYQLHLLWPSGVDMKRFQEKYEPVDLRNIQARNTCRIDFHNEGIKYVRISTHEERSVYPIYHRILNMVKETIAENGLFSRMNRVRLPRSSIYRKQVGLDRNPHTGLFLPTLFGDELPENERIQWERLCRQTDSSNYAILKSELDSIIRAIQAPGQHVRMRILFTELGFRQYESPPDGQDSHDIDSFCQMLTKPLTQIETAGLRDDADLGQLVEVLAQNERFGQPETRYTLHFDFRSNDNSTLRYEREMYIGHQNELEDEANRWMRFSHAQNDNEVLEFNVLDFECLRANYQVHVGKTPLYEPRSSKQHKEHQRALQSFASQVSYTHPPEGLKASPQRRAIFPVGNPSLVEHEERMIARFYLKDSDARFELIRKDKFPTHASGKLPQSTTWVAQYYYPHWDTLLGEFGNIEAGGKVSWPKKMESFFIPENAYDDNRPLPKGFRAFIAEVEEIQQILHEAIGGLPPKGRIINGVINGVNDATNGMNGMTLQ